MDDVDDDCPFTATDLICIYRAYPQVSRRVARCVSAALVDRPEFLTLRDVIEILHKELMAFKGGTTGHVKHIYSDHEQER